MAASEQCRAKSKFSMHLFEDCKIGVLKNVSQHSQENTCAGVSFLINIVVGQELKLIVIQKEAPALVFS